MCYMDSFHKIHLLLVAVASEDRVLMAEEGQQIEATAMMTILMAKMAQQTEAAAVVMIPKAGAWQ